MKNKLLTFLLVFGIVGLLVGCSKISKNILDENSYTINEEKIEEVLKNNEGNDLLELKVVKPILEDKQELEFAKADIEQLFNNYLEYYKGEYLDRCIDNEFFLSNNMLFNCELTFKTYKANKEVISIVLEEAEYSGGAHGSDTFTALNYDVTNQKILNFDALFKENYKDKLKERVQEKIEELINEEDYAIFQDYSTYFDENFKSENFYLDGNKLVIIYNQYDIAPYSEGTILVELDFNEIKDILNERFLEK